MKKLTHMAAAALGLAISPSLFATTTLSWEQSVALAAKSNPELVAARHSVQAGEYGERAAYGGFFPQINGTLSFQRQSINATGAPSALSTGYTSSLGVTENLFTGLADKARVDLAKGRSLEAQAVSEQTRARVSFDLKSAFASLVYAQKAIELDGAILGRRRQNFNLVQLRFEGGRENKGSVLLSRSYLEQAELDAVQARLDLQTSQAALARTLGLEHQDLVVTGTVPRSSAPADVDWNELALRVPDYRIAVSKEKQSDAQFVLARAPFFPSLTVTGAMGTGGVDFYPRDNSSWTVGVALVIPIFNGGSDFYATRSAAELAKAAARVREDSLRKGSLALKQTLAGFTVAVRKLELDRGFVQAARIRSLIGTQKYNNGLLTFEDWDLIENDYIQRQKTLLRSERDRVVAEAVWEQAQGKGVFQ